jgi:hypothetical protein
LEHHQGPLDGLSSRGGQLGQGFHLQPDACHPAAR